MKKFLITISLVFAVLFQVNEAQALRCLPVDMYLDVVVGDETTQIFVGTATEVKNHTQVVTVSKVLQGWVAPQVWVNHPYSNDWQYSCSNGPAVVGKPTIFLTIMDQYNARSVTQTLALDSEEGKNLIAAIEKEKIDAGITDVTAEDRKGELMITIKELIGVLIQMIQEFKYWQSK